MGSTHHEVLVTADDFQQNWSKLSWHRDAPLSEPADVAVFRLAQLARQEVKVVLSGECCERPTPLKYSRLWIFRKGNADYEEA